MNFSSSLLKGLLDFVYPPRCSVCASFSPAESTGINLLEMPLLCPQCNKLLEEQIIRNKQTPQASSSGEQSSPAEQCIYCAEANVLHCENPPICLGCHLSPLPGSAIRSLFYYRAKTTALIKRFKYHSQRRLGRDIGRALALAAAGELPQLLPFPRTDWDLITAVPSSLDVLRKRGFFHLGQVIPAVSRKLLIPADVFALRSAKLRRPQAGLQARERIANVGFAFRAEPRRVRGKNILLIDDVITTGASLLTCALALKEAGAKRIDALTFARSPRFSINQFGRLMTPHA